MILSDAIRAAPILSPEREDKPVTAVQFADGRLDIRNPALFQRSQIALVESLSREILEDAGVSSVFANLDFGTFCIRWLNSSTDAEMASRLFVRALKKASTDIAQGWACSGRISGSAQLVGYRWGGRPLMFEVSQPGPGRMRFLPVGERDLPESWRTLARGVSHLPGVHRGAVKRWPKSRFELEYDPGMLSQEQLLRAMGGILQYPAVQLQLPEAAARRPLQVRGPRRYFYFVMAGGSLALSMVGLMVPGIPTVPFLLAGSFYLARSSRRLHDRLTASRFPGQMLTEWETYRAMSLDSKRKLIGFSAVVIIVTGIMVPASPWVLVSLSGMAVLTLFGISRIPSLPEDRDLPRLA